MFWNTEILMRAILGGVLAVVLVTTAGLSADEKGEKVDATKLVGKWVSKVDDKTKLQIEFTQDGKYIANEIGGRGLKLDGTYKVDGNKLAMTFKVAGEDLTDTHTIVKLTDTELEYKDARGNKDRLFTRVKGRK